MRCISEGAKLYLSLSTDLHKLTQIVNMNNENFLFKDECFSIIGSCMAVHRELGHGFL